LISPARIARIAAWLRSVTPSKVTILLTDQHPAIRWGMIVEVNFKH
jgi:hypothetical protein